MAGSKEERLEAVLEGFSGYFDIERELSGGESIFDARAIFHSRSEKYVLVKSAKLWAAEMNEYAYFKLANSLKEEDVNIWSQLAVNEGMKLVKPHREHMYSYITLIIIADSIDKEMLRVVRRQKYKKSFKFAFYGWTELHVAAIDAGTGRIYTNTEGRALEKSLGKII